MAKAYTYADEKRRWADNVAKGLRRSAEAARCPICERKGAYRKIAEDYYLPIGLLVKRCRWCGFTRTYDLEAPAGAKPEESYFGKKTCEDCERRDKHSHCNECGSTKHGAAYCDNLG